MFVRARERRRLAPEHARQGLRDPDRRELRLRRRPHLGRLRHVLRPRDAAPLSAHRPAHRRHRPAARGPPPLGGGRGHLLHGNVDLHAMAWLLVGSIPGVLLGSHLSIRVPERAIRTAFAFTLVLSGIKLVGVPGRDDDHRGRRRPRRARAPRLGRAPAAKPPRPRRDRRGLAESRFRRSEPRSCRPAPSPRLLGPFSRGLAGPRPRVLAISLGQRAWAFRVCADLRSFCYQNLIRASDEPLP